jgi:uncharacterized membrane protein
MVTTLWLKEVPRGTNGGMSLLGTVASACGGIFIGTVYWIGTLFEHHSSSNIPQWPVIILGLIAGTLGSLYDSLLGGVLQATYYSVDQKCIIKSFNGDPKINNIKHISGMDILSNDAVNFISIILTTISTIPIAPFIFCLFDKNQCT